MIIKSIRDTYEEAHLDEMTKKRKENISTKYHQMKRKISWYYSIDLDYDFTWDTLELFTTKLIVFYESHSIRKPPFTELI